MIATKRTIIEISSDDDDDNPLVTPRKIRRLRTKSQPKSQSQPQNPQPEANKKHDHAALADFLARALPTKLIPADIAAYIFRESNIRLETAKQDGVTLDAIYIGDDCLPTWSGMQWDPEAESLHCIIQNRLLDLQVSQELGDLVRRDIVTKGNRKLEEARQLGIALRDIVIGDGLLAAWKDDKAGDKAGDKASDNMAVHSMEEPIGEGDLADDEMGAMGSDWTIPHPQLESICDSPHSETFSFTSTKTRVPSPPCMSYDSSSTDSDSSSESDGVDSDDFDDVMTLNNFVHHQPSYSEADGPHIVHDIDIIGGPLGFSDVDLEIYLAEDDEDIDDLPEIELAIDREGFEYYFSEEDAVDVEIPNVRVRCSGDIRDGSLHESDVEDCESIQELCHAHHAPFERDQQPRAHDGRTVTFDGNIIIINSADNVLSTHNNASEEVPGEEEEEGPSVNIEETEYGFQW